MLAAFAVAACTAAPNRAETNQHLGSIEFVSFEQFIARNGTCCATDSLEAVQLVFDQHKPFFYHLYEQLLKTKPEHGTIELALALAEDGTVKDIGVLKSDLKNLVMAWEVVEYVKTMRFPGGKEPLVFRYPFHFLTEKANNPLKSTW